MTNELNHYIVCLGCNEQAERSMPQAREELLKQFGQLRCEEELETPALNMRHNRTPFHNQIIAFSSTLCGVSVNAILKKIEQRCGRTAEGKAQERIRMDIDLLFVNKVLMRPQEMDKPHICQSPLIQERLADMRQGG